MLKECSYYLKLIIHYIQEPDSSLYKPALETIKDFIKTSTSSMTAVPKPLKFLRPHYDDLTAVYEEWPAGDDKVTKICLEMLDPC